MFEVYNLPQDKWVLFQKGLPFRFPDDFVLIASVHIGDIHEAYDATSNINYEEFLADKPNNWYDHAHVQAVIKKRGSWFGTIFKDMVSARYHLRTIKGDFVEICEGDDVSMATCGVDFGKILFIGPAENLFMFKVFITSGSNHASYIKVLLAPSMLDAIHRARMYAEGLFDEYDGYDEKTYEFTFQEGDIAVTIEGPERVSREDLLQILFNEALIIE